MSTFTGDYVFLSDRLLTEQEAAAYLKTNVYALRRGRYQGKDSPPAYKVGSRVRYKQSELESWLKQRIGGRGNM